MNFLKILERLEIEFNGFQESVDGFFSPGLDKYNGYSEFAENLVEFENGFEGIELKSSDSGFGNPGEAELEAFDSVPLLEQTLLEWDLEDDFRKTARAYRPFSLAYPGFEIQRVPAGQLGYGVLGRCFPYSGIIQIRNDLYGDEFTEVLTHELVHMRNPHLGELDVRAATRLSLHFSPRWH